MPLCPVSWHLFCLFIFSLLIPHTFLPFPFPPIFLTLLMVTQTCHRNHFTLVLFLSLDLPRSIVSRGSFVLLANFIRFLMVGW
ncbi:hypothetical protein BO78DRAFT_65515 [Aspergillus sclerotiicarbonarius CBS 121057]|uniref:Uncharacterized protein n=1 Tax=Aspergillus sclerotiicarbonarius (strain CBS 121057 / IBT 28362) TaxID=1448318 RepID=A0A319EP03_ASPSB|nr:hypothetical protein BO78DRAFT_65515 [Aspergillus sclerotiicarbonarius CBS 121057]